MSPIEVAVVALVIAAAVSIVVIKFLKPFGKAKGSCRACSDHCSCESSDTPTHK